MKRDMKLLESDPPGLPPYITRSTVRRHNLVHDAAWMAMWTIFRKFEMQQRVNKGLRA